MDIPVWPHPHITEPLAQTVAENAILFYKGEISSADAFARIDRVARSVWHWYSGVINHAHALFDEFVGYLLDQDIAEGFTPVGPEGVDLNNL